MIRSLRNLLKAPYNQNKKAYALYRFFYWKIIRALKLQDVKFRLWNDRVLYLNHDSFQSMWIMYAYEVDWEEFNLIRDFVKEHDHVADVGANMGFYTIWFSRFIRTGTIHAFEPDERNYNRLKKNVEANKGSDRIYINKIALSNLNGTLSFTTGFDGENHISRQTGENLITVRSQKLDDYCILNNIHSLSYVKVDIEGFEYDFLEGASGLLTGNAIDIIQLEINKTLQNSGRTVSELISLIERYGYSLCQYNVALKRVEKIAYSPGRENYLCIANIALVNDRISENRSNAK